MPRKKPPPIPKQETATDRVKMTIVLNKNTVKEAKMQAAWEECKISEIFQKALDEYIKRHGKEWH